MEPLMTGSNELDFQRDADISTFISVDQARPFSRSLLPFISRVSPRKEIMEGYSIFKCFQADKFMLLFRFDMNTDKSALGVGEAPCGLGGRIMDNSPCRLCNHLSIRGRMKWTLDKTYPSLWLVYINMFNPDIVSMDI